VVKLIVSDCGYGMSEDFVRHNIYLPFAQQDSVASGIGLGLSLVKRNVDSLGGTVDIETDQASGTTATISMQTSDLVVGIDSHSKADSKSQVPVGIIPSLPKRPKDSLPVMHACFYAPSTWLHRYDKRDERSIDLMFDSLSSTLGEWYQPVLSLWQRQKNRTIPDLIFISQRNLAEFREECGEDFANVKKVVICAAIGKHSSQDRERIRQALTVADALITGAVSPSKLWEVVTSYFPTILQPQASVDDRARNKKSADIQSKSLGAAEPKEAVREQKEYHDSSFRHVLTEPDFENEQSYHFDSDKQVPDDQSTEQVAAVRSETDDKGDVEAGVNVTSGDEGAAYMLLRTLSAPTMDATKAVIKRNSTIPILQGSAQPHLLLVDDNNINLKMLGMFVSKCGIPMAQSTSVSGGQEAIEAFKVFEGRNNTAKCFDIILMDMSMPEVSGFDATSAIRRIEKASDHGHRAYIVALTGLVSDKDRSAAYEAGVDDYVTKPAGLQKVRNIIETWQGRRQDIGRVSN
jgi:CheY-like chemotaxis protein